MDIKQILSDFAKLQELAEERALQEVVAKSELDFTPFSKSLYVHKIKVAAIETKQLANVEKRKVADLETLKRLKELYDNN